MTAPAPSAPRPPYDRELEFALAGLGDVAPSTITPEMIPALRAPVDGALLAALLDKHEAESRDASIPGHDGDAIVVSIITRRGRVGRGPAFLHLHSGGMVMGNRFDGIDQFLAWAVRYNGVLVTVEYRLAPEFPDPYPVEDSYAGWPRTVQNWVWMPTSSSWWALARAAGWPPGFR